MQCRSGADEARLADAGQIVDEGAAQVIRAEAADLIVREATELRLSMRMSGQGLGQSGRRITRGSARIPAPSNWARCVTRIGSPFRRAPSPAAASYISSTAGA